MINLPVVANTSGSAGLKRTEITVSEPQEKLLIGSDLSQYDQGTKSG